MKTSDILTKAAEIMIERGHGKGRYVDNFGHVCILGASALAAGWDRDKIPSGVGFCPGYKVLKEVCGDVPHCWNDRDETTEAMALGALHEAAILAKEQGD